MRFQLLTTKLLLVLVFPLSAVAADCVVPSERSFAEFFGGEQGRAAVRQQFASATFRVLSNNAANKGTGFFISRDGYAITATHVVRKELPGENPHPVASKIQAESRLWPNATITLALVDSVSVTEGDVALYRIESVNSGSTFSRVSALPPDVPVFQVALNPYSTLVDHYAFGYASLTSNESVLDVDTVKLYSPDQTSDVHEVKLQGTVDSGFSGGPLTNSRGLTIGLGHKKQLRAVIGEYRLFSTPAVRDLVNKNAYSSRAKNLAETKPDAELLAAIGMAVSTAAPYFSNFEVIALWKELQDKSAKARECLFPSIARRELVIDRQLVANLSTKELYDLGRLAYRDGELLFGRAENAQEQLVAGVSFRNAEMLLSQSVLKSASINHDWSQRVKCLLINVDPRSLPPLESELLGTSPVPTESECGDGSTYQFMASRFVDIIKSRRNAKTAGINTELENSLLLTSLASELASNRTTQGEAFTLTAQELERYGRYEAADTAYGAALLFDPENRQTEYQQWKARAKDKVPTVELWHQRDWTTSSPDAVQDNLRDYYDKYNYTHGDRIDAEKGNSGYPLQLLHFAIPDCKPHGQPTT